MKEVYASAPSKFVILGEHSVVYGKPALALAIDMRFKMRVRRDRAFNINDRPADIKASPHMNRISSMHGMMPVSVHIDGRVPSGAGLGSSAALSVAFAAAMDIVDRDKAVPEDVAKAAFEAEYFAQGRGSPMDTSASTHGGGIALNVPHSSSERLWTVEKDGRSWDISDVNVPEMSFVIGNTRIRAATGPLVEKVRIYKEKNGFASDIIDEMGDIALDGLAAIRRNDLEELGSLMTYNHKLLSILGVSCRELNKLCEAAMPYSYGAKLTGSGGGGCMVALTDSPERVADAIRSRGGIPYIVRTGVKGFETRTSDRRRSRKDRIR